MKPHVLIAILLACCACAHAGTVMSVDPPAPVVLTGDTFTVNVNLLSDNPNITSFDFAVLFPTSLLQVVSVTETGFFGANGCCFSLFFDPLLNIDNVNGIINSLTDSSTGGPDNAATPDTLVSIQFQAIAEGQATIQLACDQNDPLPCATFPMLSDNTSSPVGVDTLQPSTVSIVPEPSAAVLLLAFTWGGLALRRKAR
jgi:hypothetical protein